VGAEEFEELRPLLFSIAYRILGSVTEAEDAVQETWLRYHASKTPPISLRSFLSAVVTRVSIDVLRSARVRREAYVGQWLPEPLLTQRAAEPLVGLDPAQLLVDPGGIDHVIPMRAPPGRLEVGRAVDVGHAQPGEVLRHRGRVVEAEFRAELEAIGRQGAAEHGRVDVQGVSQKIRPSTA